MADLPTGTVTFLLAEIADAAWPGDAHPRIVAAGLAHYNAVVRRAIASCGGTPFDSSGNMVCGAFSTAAGAAAAALAAQRALSAQSWVGAGLPEHPPYVRMALHTGAVELQVGAYVGLSIERAACLLSVGHGGQILLSRATQELLRDHLPPQATLYDLGERRLRDLSRPEHIFQLGAPDLPAEFPAIETLDRHATNLPTQATPLIGRAQTKDAVCALLRRHDVRLVTLTGPGGAGKTRLGLQAAADLLDDFADGVYLVVLAAITDPGLVVSTIAATLDVKEVGDRSTLDLLKAFLQGKRMLLLLDNFEQVLSAAPLIVDLLAAAPRVKVLVTSRAVLHVSGEYEIAVPPLDLPSLQRMPAYDTLSQYAAVALFIQRAQAVKADFAITSANAPAIAEICQRLDGLPLAIELAAARIKILPPQALLARLTSRLQLLTGGARDLPARQQTMRGTIGWSYALLDSAEQTLFRRLAVFVGGCSLEAAETVTALNVPTFERSDVLDGLAALVDKSLLREEDGDGEPRFVMLETIREYATEQLEASDEAQALRGRHAEFFLKLAEEAEPGLLTGEQCVWLERLEQDHGNLRAAISYCLGATDAGGSGLAPQAPRRVESGLRLAGALCWFWLVRGYVTEGRRWLAAALAAADAEPAALRAKIFSAAGTLAFVQNDHVQAIAYHRQALALYQDVGDRRGIAFTLNNLAGQAIWQGDFEQAARLFAESLPLARAIGDRWLVSTILTNMGLLAREQGDGARASAYHQESLALYREVGDPSQIATALINLAEALIDRGDLARATALLDEGLALARAQGNRLISGVILLLLGKVARSGGDHAHSAELYGEALAMFQEVGFRRGAAEALEGLAALADAAGACQRAARLCGAAATLREAGGTPVPPADRPAYDQIVATARRQLGDEAFEAVWAAGRAMTPEQALAVQDPAPASVTAAAPAPSQPAAAAPGPPAGLTEREVEVLRLLAQGLSYAEIADRLVISPRTVNRHLTSIYGKLDVTSRHAATRFAIDHGLL